MTLEEIKRRATIQTARFYAELETLLKRHQPTAYAPYASSLMRRGRKDDRLRGSVPPHRVLHSVEANCAFVRGQHRDPVTWDRVAAVMNAYHRYDGVWEHEVIQQGRLDYFFLLLHREQLEVQYAPFKNDLARPWAMFVTSNRAKSLATAFEARYGISVREWLHLCFTAYVAAERLPSGAFDWSVVTGADFLSVRPQAFENFLRHTALSPREIGTRFRRVRETTPPFLHICIRSGFLERPLVDFGGGQLLAPSPALVFRHGAEGLYRLARELQAFDRDFGDSFEDYVGEVLRSLTSNVRVLDGRTVKSMSIGKSCDYIVEAESFVLLVECKACSFVSRVLTEQRLAEDGSTDKAVRGMLQLHATARDLARPALAPLGVDGSKPVFGIVVTYGELPLANSEWYFNTFFAPRLAKLGTSTSSRQPMPNRPAVMSVYALELLCALMNATGRTPLDLAEDRAKKGYLATGDWSPFLEQELRAVRASVRSLASVQRAMDDFFATVPARAAAGNADLTFDT